MYSFLHPEIRDTLTLLDKVVANKETRTIAKITKNVRKYKRVIAPHHIIALYESLSLEVPASVRTLPSFNPAFTEKLELNKNLAGRVVKTLELEGFVRVLLIEVLWKEGQLEECLGAVGELLSRIETANRRNLDNYSALLYHFLARIHERKGSDLSIRETLL